MKPQQIRDMTDDEIDAQIETAREELFNLRFRASFEEEDTGVIRSTKRTIARLMTIRQERQRAGDTDV